MLDTWKALFSSRKFWVGTLSLAATIGAVVLRAMNKIPADALIPTIAAITTTGLTVIGSIAWEDTASKAAQAIRDTPPSPSVKNDVAVTLTPANDTSEVPPSPPEVGPKAS